MEEIRSDIEQFRKSGKPVYAYLRTPGGREYYVASAADRIYLGPSDQLMLKGLRAELMYFKKTLDKVGVTVDVEHAGKYKDFGDMFTRTDMSPETREVIGSVVDGLYADMVDHIAVGRKKSADPVRGIIDQGPFTATQAQNTGLVDALAFEDQMWSELKDKLHGTDPHRVALDDYLKTPLDSVGLRGKSSIAMLVAQGDIVRGGPSDNGADESDLTSYGFDKLVRKVRDDDFHQGRGAAHRFAGRRSGGFRRDVARIEPVEQEEADGDFDVRRGGVRRILHGDDRRPDRGVSADRDRLHRRGLWQARSARTV